MAPPFRTAVPVGDLAGADFDHDDLADLVVWSVDHYRERGGRDLESLTGRRGGGFISSRLPVRLQSALASDVNGDGAADLATAGWTDLTVYLDKG